MLVCIDTKIFWENVDAVNASGKRFGIPRIPMPKGFPKAYSELQAGNAPSAAIWKELIEVGVKC